MFKIVIRGLNNGASEEAKINELEFDRNDLIEMLAELTDDLIDRNLLSISRSTNQKNKFRLT